MSDKTSVDEMHQSLDTAMLHAIPPALRDPEYARRAALAGSRVAAEAEARLAFDSDPRALEAWFATQPR
jgi:hypothetical protein